MTERSEARDRAAHLLGQLLPGTTEVPLMLEFVDALIAAARETVRSEYAQQVQREMAARKLTKADGQ